MTTQEDNIKGKQPLVKRASKKDYITGRTKLDLSLAQLIPSLFLIIVLCFVTWSAVLVSYNVVGSLFSPSVIEFQSEGSITEKQDITYLLVWYLSTPLISRVVCKEERILGKKDVSQQKQFNQSDKILILVTP